MAAQAEKMTEEGGSAGTSWGLSREHGNGLSAC